MPPEGEKTKNPKVEGLIALLAQREGLDEFSHISDLRELSVEIYEALGKLTSFDRVEALRLSAVREINFSLRDRDV